MNQPKNHFTHRRKCDTDVVSAFQYSGEHINRKNYKKKLLDVLIRVVDLKLVLPSSTKFEILKAILKVIEGHDIVKTEEREHCFPVSVASIKGFVLRMFVFPF